MSSSVLLSLCFLLISIGQLQQPHSVVVVGFTPISTAVYQRHPQHQFVGSRYFMTDYVEESNNNSNENDDSADFGDAGVLIEDLSWRVEKMRLEEQNKQRFLKAKPRFLPYADAAKWVQAWGQRWKTQQDWQDWIMMGEKRNSYIPSRPEEYFTRTGEWISWDDFLGVSHDAPEP